MHIEDGVELIALVSGVAAFRPRDYAIYVTASWVSYHVLRTRYVIRSLPLYGEKVQPAKMIYNSTASHGDRKKKKKTRTHTIPWLFILLTR